MSKSKLGLAVLLPLSISSCGKTLFSSNATKPVTVVAEAKSQEAPTIPATAEPQPSATPALTPTPMEACKTKTLPPVIGDVKPKQAWHWTGYTDPADSRLHYQTTYSSPAVGDLDGDGLPEVVVVASMSAPYRNVNGPLVILDGKTGSQKWVLWSSQSGTPVKPAPFDAGAEVSTTPALFSSGGKNYISYVQVTAVGRRVAITEVSKAGIVSTKYSGEIKCSTSCMAHVANLNSSGEPQIVAGDSIINLDGSLQARLDPQPESLSYRSTVTVAEINGASPGPEIIVNGAQIYSSAGNLLKNGNCYGYSAVADLEGKGNKLICVGLRANQIKQDNGWMVAFNGDGSELWQAQLSGYEVSDGKTESFGGGPANIGNFNDTPELEIGVAVGPYYGVFDHNGKELWRMETQDGSTLTGSTLFDLNGDKKVEILYNDEVSLQILAGDGTKKSADGKIEPLWKTDNFTGTLYEYPIIANLDEHESAEIIVSSAGKLDRDPKIILYKSDDGKYVSTNANGGVRAFHDPSKTWVKSRSFWNQYNYFVEAFTDAMVPLLPNGSIFGFRVNQQGSKLPGETICPKE